MTNLKQEEILKALIQLVNMINDGHHNKELGDLKKVSNVLFNELNYANRERFLICLDKKMKEN